MNVVHQRLMLRLFRRKMISVVKYFWRNHFKKKWFLENIFRRLACTKKLRNAKIRVWKSASKFGRIPAVLARSGRISVRIQPEAVGFRSESGLPASDDGDRMSPDSSVGWILTTDNCWIPTIRYQTCV
jgi:hypothetical protein